MFICILLIPEFKIEIRRQVGDLSLVKEEQWLRKLTSRPTR
jgi:hypothetical protein